MRKHARTEGFTLLELLVAIMILTIVMTVAFGAVRVSSRSYDAGIERADASEALRTSVDFLRRQLAHIAPVSKRPGTKSFAFEGTPTSIRFIAFAPRHRRAGGLIVYSISAVVRNDALRQLTLSYGPFDPGADDPLASRLDRQLALTDELAEISFQYFGSDDASGSEPTWHDEWSKDANGLPELVRVSLVAADDAEQWPEVILQTRVEESS